MIKLIVDWRERWDCRDSRENARKHCGNINVDKDVFKLFSAVGICSPTVFVNIQLRCQCDLGFKMVKDDKGDESCEDENECEEYPDICGEREKGITCDNALGGFR